MFLSVGGPCVEHLSDARLALEFDAPRAADGLSPIAHHFTGSVIAHARALSGMLNPAVKACRRFVMGGLSPKFANWGHDNRIAMLRLCSERGPAARAELRSGDGAANPYLVTAAVLAADTAPVEAIGAELIEPFLRNKRSELGRWEAHLNRLTAREMDEYAEV